MNVYTGVGSRATPQKICNIFTRIANRLEERGFLLRSGGATGADIAFEVGCKRQDIFTVKSLKKMSHEIQVRCSRMAQEVHPNWDACNEYAKMLHARNCLQVLGPELNAPSQFLLCWTHGGLKSGGTRTAIVLAEQHSVPVINFGAGDIQEKLDKIRELVES